MKYIVKTKTDQIVTRHVDFVIEAGTEAEAKNIAKECLHVYPKATSQPVVKALTIRQDYWVPRDITIIEVKTLDEKA